MTKRSAWALGAGVVVVVVASLSCDVLMHLAGVLPPLGQPIDDVQGLVASSYRVVIGAAGGWLTARLAPDRPMQHALLLGLIGTVLGLIGLIATWSSHLGPHWYPIAHVALAIPETWLGGLIASRPIRARMPPPAG